MTENAPEPFAYQHATAEDFRVTLIGRLRGLESEHMMYATLETEARNDAERNQYGQARIDTEHVITSFRKRLSRVGG